MERIGPAVMSFGDGLQETDVFLVRLLSPERLRIEHKPSVSWSDPISGYELRGFAVALD